MKTDIDLLKERMDLINNRLIKYVEKTGEDKHEIIRYFRKLANPYNLKLPMDTIIDYCELIEGFLNDQNI